LALSTDEKVQEIARSIVAGKIQNTRYMVLRAARESSESEDGKALRQTASSLENLLDSLKKAGDIDTIRGVEGFAAKTYFSTFSHMVKTDRDVFSFTARSRRPPKDRLNALLSFLYTLVLNDCTSAVEGVGLDPQVGYLHALRPGRPALALDLMEELRPIIADRLVLTLINRRQVQPDDFSERPGGAVLLEEKGRKEVIVAYQKRKQEETTHVLLDKHVPYGLIPHVQARLLARHLQGDTDSYVPFLQR
jgi:CRISPR-associated protein Cas1